MISYPYAKILDHPYVNGEYMTSNYPDKKEHRAIIGYYNIILLDKNFNKSHYYVSSRPYMTIKTLQCNLLEKLIDIEIIEEKTILLKHFFKFKDKTYKIPLLVKLSFEYSTFYIKMEKRK